jgi:hypothetical protein
VSTYEPERYHAEGQNPSDPGAADWPPLDQPSELVQRLRSLQWPEASREARQRCWTELSRQMEALTEDAVVEVDSEDAGSCPSGARQRRGTDGQHDRRFGRHDFASRVGVGRQSAALAERVAATRGLASAARI